VPANGREPEGGLTVAGQRTNVRSSVGAGRTGANESEQRGAGQAGSYQVVDGDTWDSIAQASNTPVSWLMMSNGQDPDASPPPSDPDVGSVIQIPDPPPSYSVAPGNSNSLDLGPGGMDSVRIRLHDDTPSPMQNVRYTAT
jgi:LysM repeat protein